MTTNHDRTTTFAAELSRIQAEYQRRAQTKYYGHRGIYSYFNEAAFLQQGFLELNLLSMLKKHSFSNLAEKKILDVGCGSGWPLQRFIGYGAYPENLSGIDLVESRIKEARRRHPAINWLTGSAHELPYPDATFDLVTGFIMLSSVLDEQMQQCIANEMWRVLKPDGLIFFYDLAYSNPWNPAVRGITRKQIKQLFGRPQARFDFRSVTLAPPIARLIAPHAYWLAFTLQQLRILNTHLACIIQLD